MKVTGEQVDLGVWIKKLYNRIASLRYFVKLD